jgi:hypothetical protein
MQDQVPKSTYRRPVTTTAKDARPHMRGTDRRVNNCPNCMYARPYPAARTWPICPNPDAHPNRDNQYRALLTPYESRGNRICDSALVIHSSFFQFLRG